MPRGGKRLGAGRKPLTRTERWLGGNAGKRPLALVTVATPAPQAVASVAPSVEGTGPPVVLTEEESRYWSLWAPLASGRGLLTSDTAPGLALLCQTARRADLMWADICIRGMVLEKVTIDVAGQVRREYKSHPLLGHWRALMQRTEQLQARYGIAADGKGASEQAETDTEHDQLARLLSVR